MICRTGRSDMTLPSFLCLRSGSAARRISFARISYPNFLRLDELHIQRDGYFLADQNTAGFERCVPGQAEVLAVDLGGGRNRDSRIAPRILRRGRGAFCREYCLARDAMNRQTAFHCQFPVTDNLNTGGLERER